MILILTSHCIMLHDVVDYQDDVHLLWILKEKNKSCLKRFLCKEQDQPTTVSGLSLHTGDCDHEPDLLRHLLITVEIAISRVFF